MGAVRNSPLGVFLSTSSELVIRAVIPSMRHHRQGRCSFLTRRLRQIHTHLTDHVSQVMSLVMALGSKTP